MEDGIVDVGEIAGERENCCQGRNFTSGSACWNSCSMLVKILQIVSFGLDDAGNVNFNVSLVLNVLLLRRFVRSGVESQRELFCFLMHSLLLDDLELMILYRLC